MADETIVIADRDGVIRAWDDAAEAMFGYAPREALGQTLDLIVPPEFRTPHWEGFRKTIAAGAGTLDRATTNVPVRCKDGIVRPTPGRFVFLSGPRGGLVAIAVVFAPRAGDETPFGEVTGGTP